VDDLLAALHKEERAGKADLLGVVKDFINVVTAAGDPAHA